MKKVLITGAGSGIGRAIAQEFAQNQWTTLLVGRRLEKLHETQQTLTGQHEAFSCDLSSNESISKLTQWVSEKHSDLTCLVNNAGAYRPAPFAETDADHWNFHFQTNLIGPVTLTQKLWSTLVQNKGSVLNVSSTLGLRPIENTSAYSASKSAMNNWTQSLALEGGPLGVRVNALCPGLVDTPIHFFHESDKQEDMALKDKLQNLQPMNRMGDPADIAAMAYFLCSEKSSWTTGSLVPVDGGVGATTRGI